MKVKSILFKVDLSGNGIVNYDSKDQKWVNLRTNLNSEVLHDNTSFAKKNFYELDNGKLGYKLKISSDALKRSIFMDDMVAESPNTAHSEIVLYSYIASPTSIMRGYLYPDLGIKRKGALLITDAEQTCKAVSMIETFAKSGKKDKNVENEVSDNTFYKKETVGDIQYSTKGSIDLAALQFISTDTIFDRYSFNPDLYPLYEKFLLAYLPNFKGELGYYSLVNSINKIPEYGLKLDDSSVLEIVKIFLKKICKLMIHRKNSYAMIEKLSYKLVYDPLEDTFNNPDGWFEIKSGTNANQVIDDLSFEVGNTYIRQDDEESKKLREEIELMYNQLVEKGNERKRAKSKKSKQKGNEETAE